MTVPVDPAAGVVVALELPLPAPELRGVEPAPAVRHDRIEVGVQ
jgi:hypothetical protein